MRPAAHYQASIELLHQSFESGAPADRIMAQYFRTRRYIGAKDKAAISGHFYRVLRRRLHYQYLLDVRELPVTPELLVACLIAMQEGDEQTTNTNLQEIFSGAKFQPHRLDADVMTQLSDVHADELLSAPRHVQLNIPLWLEQPLADSLGDSLRAEMLAVEQQASTDIRVNLLQTSRDYLLESLRKGGFEAEPTPMSPWGIRFNKRVALFAQPQFKVGQFEVQDEGSQILAMLTGVKAGQKVVDFCAGAGGKTLAMAAMMANAGTIYACDVHSKRLEQLKKRSKRAGAHNIRSHLMTSEHDKWVKQHRKIADVVLIDAPCSGTGTWRRSPDSRWNLAEEDLQNLQSLQSSILNSASRLVKPGGRLFYATCSLLRGENEEQIERFLAEHPEFSASPLSIADEGGDTGETINMPEGIEAGASQLRLSPARHATDGFFVACLQRQAEQED